MEKIIEFTLKVHGIYETMLYIHHYYDINVFQIRHILVSSICTYSITYVFEFKLTDKYLVVGRNEYCYNTRQMKYFSPSV